MSKNYKYTVFGYKKSMLAYSEIVVTFVLNIFINNHLLPPVCQTLVSVWTLKY